MRAASAKYTEREAQLTELNKILLDKGVITLTDWQKVMRPT
mgnify:FL=1